VEIFRNGVVFGFCLFPTVVFGPNELTVLTFCPATEILDLATDLLHPFPGWMSVKWDILAGLVGTRVVGT
jgi:hypothetical protein